MRRWLGGRAGGWRARLAASLCACAVAGVPGAAEAQASKAPHAKAPAHAREVASTAPAAPVTAMHLMPVPEGVPVYYRGREVLRVYTPVGSLSPKERAEVAQQRLGQLVDDPDVIPSEIRIEHGDAVSEIWGGKRLIGLVTDAEAQAAGMDRHAYAEFTRARVAELITETRKEFTAEEISRGIVYALIATVLLLLVWWGVIRLARWVLRGAEARIEFLHSAALERLHLVNRATLVSWFALAVRALRVAILAAAVLAWLETVLGVLPWTRPYARLVLPWLRAPFVFVATSVLAALPNMFYIAVIVLVNLGVLRVVHAFFRAIRDGAFRFQGFLPEWAEPTYKLVRALVIAITFVAAFPYIPGSSSPAFQGVSLFLGLLVSLSSSSAISNIIAGTILTYTGAFRMGDRVQISGTTGDVVKKSLLTTHLRTIKNEVVAIPNSIVLSGSTVNYTTLAEQRGLILHTTITIGYDAPWRTVHQLLIEAALATDGIDAAPPPFVFQTALNDFYVSYEINAYTRRPHDMAAIYAALHANIQESFNKGGVEIMSAHYLSLRDGNTVTIPADHRPADYVPGRFGVDVGETTR